MMMMMMMTAATGSGLQRAVSQQKWAHQQPSSLSPTPFNKYWWGLSWYFYADDVDDVDDFDDVDDVDDVDDIDFDDADQSCQNLSGRSLMHWCWCTVLVYLEYLVVISVFVFSEKLP